MVKKIGAIVKSNRGPNQISNTISYNRDFKKNDSSLLINESNIGTAINETNQTTEDPIDSYYTSKRPNNKFISVNQIKSQVCSKIKKTGGTAIGDSQINSASQKSQKSKILNLKNIHNNFDGKFATDKSFDNVALVSKNNVKSGYYFSTKNSEKKGIKFNVSQICEDTENKNKPKISPAKYLVQCDSLTLPTNY